MVEPARVSLVMERAVARSVPNASAAAELLDEFLKEITVLPDYVDLDIHGAPPIHVLYQEVGLKESEFDRVGGGT